MRSSFLGLAIFLVCCTISPPERHLPLVRLEVVPSFEGSWRAEVDQSGQSTIEDDRRTRRVRPYTGAELVQLKKQVVMVAKEGSKNYRNFFLEDGDTAVITTFTDPAKPDSLIIEGAFEGPCAPELVDARELWNEVVSRLDLDCDEIRCEICPPQ